MSSIALVIGGTGGLGAACAQDLAKDHTVIVSGRSEAKGAAVVEKITSAGGKAAFMPIDMLDSASIHSLHQSVAEKYGRLDVALNAAGILIADAKLADTTKETFDRCMTINVTGTYLAMQEQIRLMLNNPDKSGGVIVNFSSIYGLTGCKWASAYCTYRFLLRRNKRPTAAADTAARCHETCHRRPDALRCHRICDGQYPRQRRRAGYHSHRDDHVPRPHGDARWRLEDGYDGTCAGLSAGQVRGSHGLQPCGPIPRRQPLDDGGGSGGRWWVWCEEVRGSWRAHSLRASRTLIVGDGL